MYTCTKEYLTGFSAVFRQWRADSHCRLLHGYGLQFKIVFEAETLDDSNWVYDFGSLKELKNVLESTFDHKTVIAVDDPEIETFKALADKGILELVTVPNVGVEAFARFVFGYADSIVKKNAGTRVKVRSVEVRENLGNSATFENPDCFACLVR